MTDTAIVTAVGLTHVGIATMLCKTCEAANARAQEKSQEADRLSAEVQLLMTGSNHLCPWDLKTARSNVW